MPGQGPFYQLSKHINSSTFFISIFVQVSELSETTSDAWSVDVLASDTSERQMDRLLELEQVSMATTEIMVYPVASEQSSFSKIHL